MRDDQLNIANEWAVSSVTNQEKKVIYNYGFMIQGKGLPYNCRGFAFIVQPKPF